MRHARRAKVPRSFPFVGKAPGHAFKLVCPARELRRALFLAKIVSERRVTIPLLAHVRLTVADGILSVDASDLDNHLRSTIAVDVWGSGSLAVPAWDLHRIVSRLTGEIEIEIKPDEYHLTLRSGPTIYRLGFMIADDWPTPAIPELPHSFTLQADEYRSLVEPARYAISREEVRYYLNGINLRASDGLCRVSATDGRRLAEMRIDAMLPPSGLPSIIVPSKVVRLLSEIVKSDPLALSFSIDKLHGLFQSGHVTLRSKMIDGTYPDVEKVIPKANDKIATIDTKLLLAAIARVTAACSRGRRGLRCIFENDLLTISTNEDSLWGSASESVAVSYSFAPLEIGFDFRYLRDALKAAGDTVQLAMLDGASPVTFTNPDRPGALHVLMPMRVI